MSRRVHFPGLMAMAAACLLAAGCSPTSERVGIKPGEGRLLSYYKAPMMCRCKAPGGVRIDDDLKAGHATASNFVLPIPLTRGALSAGWGDITLDQAARNGGIQEIVYADYELLSVLGVYTRAKVIVYGR